MNPEVKKLWVDALRSGEYKQGYKDLFKIDSNGNKSYCCLGVLTELYNKQFPGKLKFEKVSEIVIHKTNQNAMIISDVFDKSNGHKSTDYLILPVMQWAELDACDPIVYNAKVSGSYKLSTLNDDLCTFEQIAGYIENSL